MVHPASQVTDTPRDSPHQRDEYLDAVMTCISPTSLSRTVQSCGPALSEAAYEQAPAAARLQGQR